MAKMEVVEEEWRVKGNLSAFCLSAKFHIFFEKQLPKIHHKCLQYENVFKILYFNILNIAKFG
jgi:hypothetical protein